MTIYVPDISSAQGDISLRGALAAGIKITEGTTYLNPYYAGRVADAQHNGAWPYAYHFLHAGNGDGQAAWCHAHAGTAPVMVDFEPYPQIGSNPHLPDAVAFIDGLRHRGGVTQLVYLPHWYWQELGSPDLGPLRDRGMHLVSSAYTSYTDADSGTGWQPYGGMTPAVWQYTDRLHFNGASVDFNAFRGSYAGKQDAASVRACLAEFRALVSGSKPAPAPAPAPDKPVPRPDQPQMLVTGGYTSFRAAMHYHSMTVQEGLWLMAAQQPGGYRPAQAAYIDAGDWNAHMPEGMDFWVGPTP